MLLSELQEKAKSKGKNKFIGAVGSPTREVPKIIGGAIDTITGGGDKEEENAMKSKSKKKGKDDKAKAKKGKNANMVGKAIETVADGVKGAVNLATGTEDQPEQQQPNAKKNKK